MRKWICGCNSAKLTWCAKSQNKLLENTCTATSVDRSAVLKELTVHVFFGDVRQRFVLGENVVDFGRFATEQ
jgi:uncharacterized lipoprotein YajG